jgi:hypothetical protein
MLIWALKNCCFFRYICFCLQRYVNTKWPNERLVKTRVVSGFIFLRLICPAILNPRQFNLLSGQLNHFTFPHPSLLENCDSRNCEIELEWNLLVFKETKGYKTEMSLKFGIIYFCLCGKLGVLPNGHAHIKARVSIANLFSDINCQCNLFLSQTNFEGWQKEWIFLSKVCHGRFHDILPKEYSGTFPKLLWGKMI